jgi:hypothetical protein
MGQRVSRSISAHGFTYSWVKPHSTTMFAARWLYAVSNKCANASTVTDGASDLVRHASASHRRAFSASVAICVFSASRPAKRRSSRI